MFARLWTAMAVLAVVPDVHAEGTYSVVAPKILRPNRDYTVAVSVHGTRDVVRATVEVGGRQDSGGVILNRQVVDIEPDSTKTIKFEIGELGSGEYNLTINGYGGLTFENSTSLKYVGKSYSVFIQTDRGIYKPGDTIKFRVIVVNPFLRPSVTGAIDIFVADGNNNRVKQWRRVFTNKGVFTGEIELSEDPVLGNWNITVDVLGQKTEASVLVALYVLPKFEVEVLLPRYVTFNETRITATIKARYTYGRPVKGEVTLQVVPTFKYGYLQAPYDKPISVVKQLKGKTDITLNLRDDLKLKDDYVRELEFTAYVQEELTGRVQNASSRVTMYRYPYRMELVRTSDSFKPGLKYTAFLKLSYHDDTPLREGEVVVRHAFSRNLEDFIETKHKVPFNGIVPLEFYPPLEDEVLNLALEAQYGELTQWLADLSRAQSPSNAFLQATLLTADPEVGGEVVVGLNSTQPLVYFVYEIIGRGDIIYAQTLQAHKGTTHVFRFVATVAMAPRARLIIYYVKEDGEIVADSLHFSVRGAIQTEVSISVNPATIDAGGDVSITVTAKPNAFIGITAVDQSSLLLRSPNDLKEDIILKELEDYDPGYVDAPSPWHYFDRRRRRRRSLVSWHGTTTAGEVFQSSGVVVMTNGLLYNFNPFLYYRTLADGPDLRAMESRAAPVIYSASPDNRHRARSHFLETWIFAEADSGFNGVVTLKEKAPDSITSYSLSAFAIDDFYGLGVSAISPKLTVFRPFFISLHLPPSIKRGEAVAVEMVVFNYGQESVTANVTLFNNQGEFVFPDFANEIDQGSPEKERTKVVKVPSNDGYPVSFMIVPQKLGGIEIKVSAVAGSSVDIVTKTLLVEPEGSSLTVNRPLLVDLRAEQSFSEVINITTPRNVVEDSLKISVSVIGDILGGAVMDLGNLLEVPTGCGEQNMAKMVPNIVLVEYLKNKNQLSTDLLERGRRNLETGYQRQLTFRHKNGSFSAFGEKDVNGSTWLTAFVAKSFWMARRHINIEDTVIEKAVEWLMSIQHPDGSFKEVGVVNNAAIQGGTNSGVPLTAYVLSTLLELQEADIPGMRNTYNRGLEYLLSQLQDMKDPYSLALTTYVLQLASHPHRDTAFYQLEAKATVKDDKKWWEDKPVPKTVETVTESRSLDIEMTSYALLTYTLRGLARDAIPILRWLTAQRNQYGGFQSTQDTVVGMTALAALAKLISTSNPRLEVQVISGARGDTVRVNNNNAMILQRREVSSETDSLMIKARGSGIALVQVTYSFNVDVTAPRPAFSLDPQLDKTTDSSKLRLTACTGFTGGNASNMAVMDVSLPSGYIVDNDLIPGIYDYPGVKRVEKKEEDSGVLIYFDYLTPAEVCPTVAAYRVSKVAFQKRTPVKVYDYYDRSRQARQFYEPAPATLCDICDLDECDPSRCEEQIIQLNRQRQDPADFSYPAIVEETSGCGVPYCSLVTVIIFVCLMQLI